MFIHVPSLTKTIYSLVWEKPMMVKVSPSPCFNGCETFSSSLDARHLLTFPHTLTRWTHELVQGCLASWHIGLFSFKCSGTRVGQKVTDSYLGKARCVFQENEEQNGNGSLVPIRDQFSLDWWDSRSRGIAAWGLASAGPHGTSWNLPELSIYKLCREGF